MVLVPAVIFSCWISGAAAAVCIGCLVLWRARPRVEWLPWMAFVSGCESVIALSQMVRNSCLDPATGGIALRILTLALLLCTMAWMGLFRAFCGVTMRRTDWLLTAVLIAGLPIAVLSPGGYALTSVTSITTIQAGWWGPISVLQGPRNPALPLFHILWVVIALRLIWMTLDARQRLSRTSLVIMLVVIMALLVPIIHGYGLLVGWWKGVPLVEYALTTMFVLLSFETHRRERSHYRQERDRQVRLEAVLGHGLSFAGLLDVSGHVVLVNRVALKAFDLESVHVIGRPFPESPWWVHSPQAQQRLRAAIIKAAAGDADRFLTTHRLPDGSELDIDFSLTPFRGDDGQVQYLIAEGRDISELRRFERLMREGSRLEAIGQIAGGIAHDFNNVLGGIMGSAELALMHSKDPKLNRRLEMIISAASKAGDLTKRLLSYARKSKTSEIEVRINAMAAETLELFQGVAGPGIVIERRLRATPDSVTADPAELQSALLNLCVNARDAMPSGGRLIIATSRMLVSTGLADCVGQPVEAGEYVRLDVIDAGTGIAPNIRPRIFEAFFTTKPEGQGTGLGLSAVLGAVRVHHGALLMETAEGRGTTMSMLLPAVNPGAAASRRPGTSTVAGDGLVVLVDDEIAVRELASELLGSLGLRVESFADPLLARDRLQNLSGVRCLLLDLAMPKLDGRELYRTVRAASTTMPVIISSGFAGGGQILGGDDDPFLVFLPKPWRLEQLRQALLRLRVLSSGEPG
jgi:PAS domain S-box-containing protein